MDLRTYCKTISAKGKEVMRAKKAQGEVMHLAPIGYRNVHYNGKSLIERDPVTYPLVQDAKKMWRQQGHSIRFICNRMAKRGLRSKRGKRIGLSSMLLVVRRP
jgi:hypothetical protein